MHCDTGHLVDTRNTPEEELNGYRPVPKSHHEAAKKKLAGKKDAYVSLTSGGKLSRLCKQWRKEKRERYIKKLGTQIINRRRKNRRSAAKHKVIVKSHCLICGTTHNVDECCPRDAFRLIKCKCGNETLIPCDALFMGMKGCMCGQCEAGDTGWQSPTIPTIEEMKDHWKGYIEPSVYQAYIRK